MQPEGFISMDEMYKFLTSAAWSMFVLVHVWRHAWRPALGAVCRELCPLTCIHKWPEIFRASRDQSPTAKFQTSPGLIEVDPRLHVHGAESRSEDRWSTYAQRRILQNQTVIVTSFMQCMQPPPDHQLHAEQGFLKANK